MEWFVTLDKSVSIGLALLFGLMIGSFINVVVVRVPPRLHRQWLKACQDTLIDSSNTSVDHASDAFNGFANNQSDNEALPNLWWPRSHCPKCKHPIAFYDNIPVVSWLILKGRCRHCDAPISARYPIIEILTALLWMIVVWKMGWSLEALSVCAATSVLVALSAIDLEHQILPDVMTLGLMWVGLLVNAHFQWFASSADAIIGAASGYIFLWLIFQGYFLLRGKEGLGFGDLKLLAALGAWVGWSLLPFIVFVGSVLGVIIASHKILVSKQSRDVPIAFGPYLAIAGWFALVWGSEIEHWLFPLS